MASAIFRIVDGCGTRRRLFSKAFTVRWWTPARTANSRWLIPAWRRSSANGFVPSCIVVCPSAAAS